MKRETSGQYIEIDEYPDSTFAEIKEVSKFLLKQGEYGKCYKVSKVTNGNKPEIAFLLKTKSIRYVIYAIVSDGLFRC